MTREENSTDLETLPVIGKAVESYTYAHTVEIELFFNIRLFVHFESIHKMCSW